MKQAIFFIENTYIIRADSFSYPAGLTFQTTKKNHYQSDNLFHNSFEEMWNRLLG